MDKIQSMVNDFVNTGIWWHGNMEPCPVNAAFAAAVVNARYKRTQLEDNINEFRHELTIFNFLRKPTGRNVDYEKWSNARINNVNQYFVQVVRT